MQRHGHRLVSGAGRGLEALWTVLLGLVLAVASLVLAAGLSRSFARVYYSVSGERLIRLLEHEACGPSAVAPLAWLGYRPLVLEGLPLVRGSRIELKLRSGRGTVPVRVVVDGTAVAVWNVVPAWRSYRVWLEESGATLRLEEVEKPAVPIHMARLKVTNVEGFTEGILEAWIVPATAAVRGVPWMPRTVLILLVLGAGSVLVLPGSWTRLPDSARPMLRRMAGAVTGAAVVLAAARLLAAALGYRLILTPRTAAMVLLLPGAVAGIWQAGRRTRVPQLFSRLLAPRLRPRLTLAVVVGLWCAGLLLVVLGMWGGDLRGTARFGWKFPVPPPLSDVPQLTETGYDGQFYAILASDPFLRHRATLRALDNPSYRAERILLPLLAWASAGGSARWAPFAYVLWCWLLGLGGLLVVFVWLGPVPWRGVWILLLATNAGLVVSLLRATPDAAALTLMLAALFLAERRGRTALTAACGALAVLARETSMLALPGLAWREIEARRWRRTVPLIVLPAVALVSWRLYVHSITHRGVESAMTNFGLPLAWLSGKMEHLPSMPRYRAIELTGIAWILLLLAAAASYLIWRRRPGPVLLTFLPFSMLALVLDVRVYTEVSAYARVLIAMPFLAVLLAVEEKLRWRRWLLVAGVALASLQGAMVLRMEMAQAWHTLHQEHRQRLAVRMALEPLPEWNAPGSRAQVGRLEAFGIWERVRGLAVSVSERGVCSGESGASRSPGAPATPRGEPSRGAPHSHLPQRSAPGGGVKNGGPGSLPGPLPTMARWFCPTGA